MITAVHRSTRSSASRWAATFLDQTGSLRRERPDDGYVAWSQVSITPDEAHRRLAGYDARARAVLTWMGTCQYVTPDQVARCFYDSVRTAQDYLRALYLERFVVRFDPTPSGFGLGVGDPQRPPWVYFLDWLGHYAVTTQPPGAPRGRGRPATVRTWDSSRIARPGPQATHTLGITEVWSHFRAAARRTHRQMGEPGYLPLAVGWRGEMAAQIRYSTGETTAMVRPDAEVVLRVGAPLDQRAPVFVGSGPPDWLAAVLDPTQDAWGLPPGGSDAAGVPRYRRLLLEFETGEHHAGAVTAKIAGYNGLLLEGRAAAQERYGGFPRIAVVVALDEQINRMVELWREHYKVEVKPGSSATPVLVTSVPALRRALAGGYPAGIGGRCWVHALDPDVNPPRLLTLGEALGVNGL